MVNILKYRLIFIFLFAQILNVFSQTKERNYLYSQFEEKGKHVVFSKPEVWRENEKKKILSEIDVLPADIKRMLIKRGEDLIKSEWSALKVMDYLEYVSSGKLEPFGRSSSLRHEKLSRLVIAELTERKGRFVKEILNGLWLTLEESTWVLPEHLVLQKLGSGLPDPKEVVIDLRSGDIATMVAWISLLLKDEMMNVSPVFMQRIEHELANRIFVPFLSRDDFRWMGFKNQKVNNWNIWINKNVLLTAILTIEDTEIRNKVIEKSILSADKFLNQFPDDGGLDEGISYWQHAGGQLIEFIELLTDFSQGRLGWAENKLVHNIGAYTYKTHIRENRFVNFADASAVAIPPAHYVYKYGEMFDDLDLKHFSSYLYRLQYPKGNTFNDRHLHHFITNIETFNRITSYLPMSPMLSRNWLPNIQVITLREKQGSMDGLFFAAKGGHNSESHNHNDIGNFVMYRDGKPIIIDVGVGTYTRQTFSKDRYKLWYMQSQWHNCPTINGFQQKNGTQYKAQDIEFMENAQEDIFSLNMASAYPQEAMVKSWRRKFMFSRKKSRLTITEEYELEEFIKPFELNFMTPLSVKKSKGGRLEMADIDRTVIITYEPTLFEVIVENKKIEDGKLSSVWGESLNRIIFKSLSDSKIGTHNLVFEIK